MTACDGHHSGDNARNYQMHNCSDASYFEHPHAVPQLLFLSQGKVSWAMAARNKSKLEGVRNDLMKYNKHMEVRGFC